MAEISITEWIDELRRLSQSQGDEGMTLREISAAKGISEERARRYLVLAKESDRLILGFRSGERIDGKAHRIPVYRFKEV